MNVVFMGTPEFAVPGLESLIGPKFQIVAVVTQTDKPMGRKSKLCAPPIKRIALDSGLEIIQPKDVNDEAVIAKLKDINPDIIVVVAFGQKISTEILNLPKHKCINVHASLLPEYRGAAPINWAIIKGEEESGITTIVLNEKMDAGEIIMQKSLKIGPDETTGELRNRLSILGAEVLIDSLNQIESGIAKFTPQDEGLVTYAPKLKKEDGLINWGRSATDVHNFVRGMSPWPSAYTNLIRDNSKERSIILRTEKVEADNVANDKSPGTITEISEKGMTVATKGDNMYNIRIKEVKPEGRKSMDAFAYSRGRDIKVGSVFQ